MKRKLPLMCLPMLALSAAVGGCAQEDNLVELNHHAVNRMLDSARSHIGKDKFILTTTFVDIDDFKRTSTLGRILGETSATQLTRRGHRVLSVRLREKSMVIRPRDGEFMLTREMRNLGEEYDADAVFVGTYKKTRDVIIEETKRDFSTRKRIIPGSLFVSMRLISAEDNTVMAAYDYVVRCDDEIRALARE
jgi:GGDEF domain-containing protein